MLQGGSEKILFKVLLIPRYATFEIKFDYQKYLEPIKFSLQSDIQVRIYGVKTPSVGPLYFPCPWAICLPGLLIVLIVQQLLTYIWEGLRPFHLFYN